MKEDLSYRLIEASWERDRLVRQSLVHDLCLQCEATALWLIPAIDGALPALRALMLGVSNSARADLAAGILGERLRVIGSLAAIKPEPDGELRSAFVSMSTWYVAEAERPYRAEAHVFSFGEAFLSGELVKPAADVGDELRAYRNLHFRRFHDVLLRIQAKGLADYGVPPVPLSPQLLAEVERQLAAIFPKE